MKYLFAFAAMVACCMAMPALQDRPTPINPSVLSEPKPTGKPALSKDAKDDQSPQPFYPTALPAEVSHHISKRDHKPGHDSLPVAKPNVPEAPKKSPAPVVPSNTNLKPQPHSTPDKKLPEQKRNRRDVQKVDNAKVELQKPQTLPAVIPLNDHKVQQGNHAPAIGLQKPQTLPASIPHNDHKVQQGSHAPATGLQKPQTLPALIPHNDHKDEQGNHAPTTGLQKPQTLPATLHESVKHKRDAPAPFAAPQEPSKTSSPTTKGEENSKEKQPEKNDKKEEQKAIEPSHNPNVQVEDLSDHKAVSHHYTHSASKLPHEFHPQGEHKHPTTDEQKPVTLGDIQQKPNTNKIPADSSTEHPVIRPKPVPVSELFSRHQ